MDAAGVPVDPGARPLRRLPRRARASSEGRALLALPDRPTAIFAGNDLQALGVYQAARELRLHIPEDLSVVGFDDLPVAQLGRSAADDRAPATAQMADGGGRLVLRAGARRATGADAGRARHRAGRPREHGATRLRASALNPPMAVTTRELSWRTVAAVRFQAKQGT